MSKENNKLAQLRELQKNDDKGLQYIMDQAIAILGNPLVLCDAEARLIAHPRAIANDPTWGEYFQNGMIHPEVLKKSMDAGFSDIIARPDKVVILRGNGLELMMGKVYAPDGFVLGTLTVNSRYRPFEDDDHAIVEAICKLLARGIGKLPEYQDYPDRLMDKYVKKLIEGDMEKEKSTFALNIIEMIYVGLKSNLYVAALDIGKCDPTYAKLEQFRELLRQTRPTVRYAVYANYIVFVMSTEERDFSPKIWLNRLNHVIEIHDIYVGISSRFENLFDMRRPYHEAVEALGEGLRSGQRVFMKEAAE